MGDHLLCEKMAKSDAKAKDYFKYFMACMAACEGNIRKMFPLSRLS
jgi:hypothetical protein